MSVQGQNAKNSHCIGNSSSQIQTLFWGQKPGARLLIIREPSDVISLKWSILYRPRSCGRLSISRWFLGDGSPGNPTRPSEKGRSALGERCVSLGPARAGRASFKRSCCNYAASTR
jgi:hypothetical protein